MNVDWPAHLRDDAPYQRCGRCGRCTWVVENFGAEDRMTQPDGFPCGGRFGPEIYRGDAPMKPIVWLPNDTATRLHAVPGGTEYVPGTTVTTLCAPDAGRSLTFTPILGATLPRCNQCVRLSDPPPPSETGTPLGGAAGPAGGRDA